MKTLKTLAIATIATALCASAQAQSWGFTLGNGAGFAYSRGGGAVAIGGSGAGFAYSNNRNSFAVNTGGYTTQVYQPSCGQRVWRNNAMPTVYGPREYYINGRPYIVYPTVRYDHNGYPHVRYLHP